MNNHRTAVTSQIIMNKRISVCYSRQQHLAGALKEYFLKERSTILEVNNFGSIKPFLDMSNKTTLQQFVKS